MRLLQIEELLMLWPWRVLRSAGKAAVVAAAVHVIESDQELGSNSEVVLQGRVRPLLGSVLFPVAIAAEAPIIQLCASKK